MNPNAPKKNIPPVHPAIEQAFVLGAGLGTRLKGLTARRPKPLIPVCGKPLISYAFDHLSAAGIKRFVVNTHHCAEIYSNFFPESRHGKTGIEFAYEPLLLETAGGIKNVEGLLKTGGVAPFVVYNGDILTDLPIQRAIVHHLQSGNEVTLVLRSKEQPCHIAIDPSGRVVDIAGRLGVPASQLFLFTGIYIVDPAFLARIPAQTKISVIPIFIEMIQQKSGLGAVVVDEGTWWDLGTREQYLELHRHLKRTEDPHHQFCWVHPSAEIAPSARLLGATSIGANAVIGEGATLTDCVIWENANIAAGSLLENCIATSGSSASGTHLNEDF